jgi:hypothetical protein
MSSYFEAGLSRCGCTDRLAISPRHVTSSKGPDAKTTPGTKMKNERIASRMIYRSYRHEQSGDLSEFLQVSRMRIEAYRSGNVNFWLAHRLQDGQI